MNLTVDLNGWKKPGWRHIAAYEDVIDPFFRVIFYTYNVSKSIC